jgi:hypothetical protein
MSRLDPRPGWALALAALAAAAGAAEPGASPTATTRPAHLEFVDPDLHPVPAPLLTTSANSLRVRRSGPASLSVTRSAAPSGMLSVFALLPGVTTEAAQPTSTERP